MDFDDLDEAQDVILNNQPKQGTVLPLMKRSKRLPDVVDLPMLVQKKLPPLNGEQPKKREPKLRLLCFMGAADYVCQEWCFMAEDAPTCIEVGVHEPPGHGLRQDEPISQSLEAFGDDAFEACRDAMDTGPFVLLGHSVGTLVATYVAERAKRELNVQPLLAIMIERGAPHLPAFSEYGYDMLKKDSKRFMQIRDPITSKGFEYYPQALRMWGNDLLLENDTRPVGWFTFSCPILVFRCPAPAKTEESIKEMGKAIEVEEWMNIHIEKDHLGHFGKEECEAWAEWTDHPNKAELVLVEDANHMSIKSHKIPRQRIWKELQAIVDSF